MIVDEEVAAFLTCGVSITIASRNRDMMPSVIRAKGCCVHKGATARLRIFVSASQAAELLDDVQTTQMISATFSMPATHRTLQFKGTDAQVTELLSGEDRMIAAYTDAFGEMIRPFGFSPEFTRAFLGSPPDEVAIEFTPSDAFLQTPGPQAGSRL